MSDKQEPAIVVVFDDRLEAELAVKDLEAAGFGSNHIGFVIRGSDVNRGGMITDTLGAKDAKGAMIGAGSGAVVGGVLGAMAALLLPGIGPIVAAGVLTSAIGGAAAGTAVGGILGALTGLGISEDEADYYQTHFNAGRAIVAVRPGEHSVLEAEAILRKHGGYNMRLTAHSDVPTEGLLHNP